MTAAIVPASSPVLRPSTRRGYSTAWWGMACLIMTEATIFAVLLASYFFVMARSKQWPPPGIEKPELKLSTIFSFVLWGSSIPLIWGEARLRKGSVRAFRLAAAISFVMGAAFVLYSFYDFNELHFGWRDNAYGSLHYTIVGLHLTHVCIGLGMSVIVQAKAWMGRFDHGRHVTADVFGLYWHFVDAVWLFVFPSLFLAPHLVK
jgi:heme/copper-type cytochrome/quinol oxidase subunit 3